MFSIAQHLPKSVLEAAGRKALVVQKHSPTILFVSGTVGAIASTVLACKATLKLDEILQESEKTLALIDLHMDNPDYSDKDRQKDKITLKVQTGVKVVKLYGPALGLGLASIGALTGSHYIMSSRQAGLMAAYAALDKGWKEYQDRVREELGVEREEQLRVGSVVAKGKDSEGKVTKVVRRSPGGYSPYAVLFDRDNSTEWVSTPEYNIVTLRAKQNWLNDMLKARGHVFLNDAYDLLGVPRRPEGQMVGWLRNNSQGDNYIDFGVFTNDSPNIRDFMVGDEGAVWLDFNVDGVIYDKI